MTNLNSKIFPVALILFCVGLSFAQQNISPEKKRLIQEFRQLTGSQNLTVSAKFNSTDVQDLFTASLAKEKDLTEAQKQELKKSVDEAIARTEKQIRDFFADEAGMRQLSDEVAFQLYDRNFSEIEMQEMIAFYRTSTGKKALAFLPTVKTQLGKSFSEAFGQKLKSFMELKAKAELETLEKKIQEVKAKKNEN